MDRRVAIREALKLAQAGDAVILTGKGCESWIVGKNGLKTAWDEKRIVVEELEKLGKNSGKVR
jgi:UDP-N-acetylmuramyl tripeptide synthase